MFSPDSDDEFTAFMASNTLPVVLDFTATWCGPCKNIAPTFENLATEYKDRVAFVKVDVDKCDQTAQVYDVTSIPNFVYLKPNNDGLFHTHAGADVAKLTNTCADLAKAYCDSD